MADHPSPVAEELAEARDLVLLADPEQLELIRDEQSGRDAAAAVIEADRRGRRGRPPGALNKRNAKFRDQLLAIAPHPALALARAYSTPVETLAAQLGCSKLEAAQLGIRAAAELLPYIEGKQAQKIELQQRNDVVLIMPGGGVSEEQLEQLRDEIGNADGIDWSTAEFGDVLDAVPSLTGPAQGDVA